MLKFLLYLFLIYIIVRFVFGRVFGTTIRTKVFYNTTNHYHPNEPKEQKDEGKVTIQQQEIPKRGNDKNIGEYVDYEEVK